MTGILARTRIEWVWLAIGALTVLRMAGLAASPVELHGDEAQYWSWSRELDFGYFSKPPLIAWVAAATTAMLGDAEWAVRIGSPLAHAAAALFLMAAARRRWGDRAAAWTGLLYITMPAVWLSSAVLSTDAYLLMLWSAAVWAFDRLLDGPTLARGAVLGAFVGLGFLAKYAMIYFVIGVGALALVHPASRRAIVSRAGLAAAAVVAVCIAPNLIWNAAHDFATISHTAANANWGAENFRLDKLAKFLVDQLGVFGPVSFVILVWALVAIARAAPGDRARWLPLAALTAPALAIVAVQAFLNRANANWAVASYCAGAILVAVWMLERGRPRWLAAAVGINLVIGALFVTAALSPPLADRMGLANAFKRARGWVETTAVVRAAYEEGAEGTPYAAVLVDNRLLFHDLEYYSREDPLPLRMWLRYDAPTSHAEAVSPMTPLDGPVLVVSERMDDQPRIRADFEHAAPGHEAVIDLGGGKQRRLALFPAYGFAPLERGPAYEALWDD